VRVPLPAEPQGEAIAFDPSGALVSGSETRYGVRGEIRVVPGAAALVGAEPSAWPPPETRRDGTGPNATPGAAGPGAQASGTQASGTDTSGSDASSAPEWRPAAIGAGVFGGLLLLVTGALAVRAARRR
jgi:hypothetical protein